jgi:hypothetical protein
MTYERVQSTLGQSSSLIARFVQALNDEEARQVMALLAQRANKKT